MSVLDELDELEQRVRNRMRELSPLVAEYQELERVAERLGLPALDGAKTSGQRAKGPTRRERSRAGRQRGRSRAETGRREQLLTLVNERPGITVRDAGERLKVNPTSLYRIVRQLEERGAITKDGTALRPK